MGNLILPARMLGRIRASLIAIKEKYNEFGEIHFNHLPNSYNKEFSAKSKIARDWLSFFFSENRVFFTLFGFNQGAKSFDRSLFTNSFDRYNTATRICMSSSIGYHISKNSTIQNSFFGLPVFTVYSDERSCCLEDEFKKICTMRTKNQQVNSRSKIDFEPSEIIHLKSDEKNLGEFIQLTDIVLGASRVAILGGSSHFVKKHLADMISNKFLLTKGNVVKHRYDRWRRFNIVNFPDENGEAINEFRIRRLDVAQTNLSDF